MKAVGPRIARGLLGAAGRCAIIALMVALISPARSADEGVAVNLAPENVSQTWSLGEHRARLEISLARTARVWLADNRIWISLHAANPELTTKLQASLRSTAKSGYTLIARSGSTEVGLGGVRGISLSTDAHHAVWVRAMVRLQQRTAGVTTAGEKRFTGKLEPSVVGHALVFTVKSVEIEGTSPVVSRLIAQQIPTIRLELPDCAQGLRFEKVRFVEKENAVDVTASVSGTDLFSLIPCLTGME